MPLPLRKVEPIHVSRGNLPEKFKVQNDLEAESNGTLANVILQLSSLSHHAGEIFTDLVRVATDITTRTANLQQRLDRISVKVTQIDWVQDEYSMQDCLNTKPFQSSNSFDQQVVSRSTMPAGMLKTHLTCDRPPPLEKLNVYRDDGKDGLKFYTDPSYFFDLWKQEMLKDTEKAVRKQLSEELQEPHKPKLKGEGRKPNKRIRELHKTREKQANMAVQRGEHIMEPIIRSPTDAQSSKPIEMGDSVIYPPEAMSRKMNSSRPQSMEIKQQVSFDDKIDEIKNEEKSPVVLEPVSRLEQLYSGRNSSNLYNAYTKEIVNKNDQNQNEIDKLIDQHYHQQNQMSLLNASYDSGIKNSLLNSNTNRVQKNQSLTSGNAYNKIESQVIRQSGSTTNIDSNTSRRRSSSSSNNSLRITGLSRPSQPPPPVPPSSSSSVSGVPSSMGIKSSLSQATTPTDRAARVISMGNTTRENLPPPPPPPPLQEEDDTSHHNGNMNNFPEPLDPVLPPPMIDDDEELPPPPPTPDQYGMDLPKYIKAPLLPEEYLPPSPPPPPPPLMMDSLQSPTEQQNGRISTATKEKRVIPPPVPDTRSEMLKAIREGINLKKVDEKKVPTGKEDKAVTALCDVASILARRVAVEMSDSDDSGSSDDDSDGWDETSA